jgi:hypothetical protein
MTRYQILTASVDFKSNKPKYTGKKEAKTTKI